MGRMRILLVEDHDLTRMGLKAAFQLQPDMEFVGEANNGRSGLSLLKEVQPDVALVDIGLPDIDGIEVVRCFKKFQANCGENTTRILMLTMHESEEAVMAAFAAGADSYCMKQTPLDVLMTAVRETCNGHAWIDPEVASVILRQLPKSSPGADVSGLTVAIRAADEGYEENLSQSPLTGRELDILRLIVAGCSNAEIADRCFISIGTVKTHVRSILVKLGVDDRTKAAVMALRSGLVT
jgi:DNA-binding NarL/FixJ family response regulator